MSLALLIDDEIELLEVLKFSLELEGIQVRIATNQKDALQILNNHPVEVLVTDLKIPDGDGLKIIQYARSSHRQPPYCFLMTGFTEISECQKDLFEVDCLVEKPFNLNEFTAKIKNAAESRPTKPLRISVSQKA